MTSEQMFDALPFFVDMYDKLKIEEYRKTLPQGTSNEQAGRLAFKYAIKNSPKVKQEFFEIVAIALEMDIEEVKKQPFTKVIATFINIFKESELLDFFK